MVELVVTHRIRDALVIFQAYHAKFSAETVEQEWNLAQVAWEFPSERGIELAGVNIRDKDGNRTSDKQNSQNRTGDSLDKQNSQNRTDEKLEEDEKENQMTPKERLLQINPNSPSISHVDLINLSKALQRKIKGKLRLKPKNGVFEGSHATRTHEYGPFNLPYLLYGTSVYLPPPPEKKKKTREFLRILETQKRLLEEADYQQLLVDKSAPEITSPGLNDHLIHEEDITLPSISQQTKQLKHQITTIFNIALSVVSVSYAIWYWTKSSAGMSVSARALLSIWGGLVILVAEVVVYGRYVRKTTEARVTERKKRETKQIVSTTEFRAGQEMLEFQTEIPEDECLDDVDFTKGNPLNTVLGATAVENKTEAVRRNRPVF
ncbi:Vacuolar ATPase assembly integral membrane protein [Yarrowia sp. B02]|nr:Vacuolar ATPase assembly integral membrane protein [Yarrowia sp. B02]